MKTHLLLSLVFVSSAAFALPNFQQGFYSRVGKASECEKEIPVKLNSQTEALQLGMKWVVPSKDVDSQKPHPDRPECTSRRKVKVSPDRSATLILDNLVVTCSGEFEREETQVVKVTKTKITFEVKGSDYPEPVKCEWKFKKK